MKKYNIKMWIVLFSLIFLTGCVSVNRKASNKPEPLEIENIGPTVLQAVLAVEKAKTGELESLPFVSTHPNSKIIVDKMSETNFIMNSLSISSCDTNAEGLTSLGFAIKSIDMYGRIDRRIGKINYTTPTPDKSQIKQIGSWLLKQNRASRKQLTDIDRNIIINYQKEKGLTPDGKVGPITAKTLAKDFSMIHIENLENRIFYPKVPNHMVFIVPYNVFIKNKAKLSNGFQSWMEVGKLGISKEQFKNIAKKGEKFVFFVYFFDRVNQDLGISADFSTMAKGRGNNKANKPFYAKHGTWPFIAKTFTIDDSNLPKKLYINIFFNSSSKNPFSNQCIGSHKLL